MSAPDSHLENLSSEQLEAVIAPPGPALVLAGAGSGKTRVIVRRILHLLSEGASSSAILALTFTNKAAGEMKERLRDALGPGSRGVWIGTFHAIGARILRAEYERVGVPRDFVVMSRGECLTLIKRAMKKEGINPERYPPRDILEWIGRIKTRRGPEGSEAFPHSSEAVASRLAKPYEKLLRDAGGVDFDDLLALPLVLFRKHTEVLERYRAQFTEILVDEYQDTNAVQHRLIRLLAGEGHRVFAVGDDDQSIYRWRGAEVENIRRFEIEFPGARVFRLEENYRCSGRILAAATGVMRRSSNRREKNLYTNNPEGGPVVYFAGADPQVEAQMIFQRLAKAGAGEAFPWGEAAVFYRTNTQSRALEEEARRRKVPYQIVKGQRFFDRAEVQDLSSYLRAALNPTDAAAFTRIVNRPTRGLGPAKILAIAGGDEDGLISVGAAGDALASGLVIGAAGQSLQELIVILGEFAGARLGPVAMLNEIIERTGYRRWLEETSRISTSLERRAAASRGLEGVGEFLAAAAAFEERIREEEGIKTSDPEAMIRFMEDMALSSEADDMEDEGGRLSLMTLHAAKGLEFHAVAMAGVSDGLIPHGRSIDEPESLEEERRLLYVGMTRAKKILLLSYAVERRPESGSGSWEARPSRFLNSLGDDLIIFETPPVAPERFEQRRPRGGRSQGGGGWERYPDRSSKGGSSDKPAKSQQIESKVPDKALGPYAPGARVLHAKFGEGLITSRSGIGERATITINFEQVGEKKLVLQHANLTPVGEG